MVPFRRRPTGNCCGARIEARRDSLLPGRCCSAASTPRPPPLLWREGGPLANTIACAVLLREHHFRVPPRLAVLDIHPAWTCGYGEAIYADCRPRASSRPGAGMGLGADPDHGLHGESPHGQRCQARRCQA